MSVINGVWALPLTHAHVELFTSAAAKVCEQGGRAVTFSGEALSDGDAASLVAQFRADRGREYEEFAERADTMLAEIEKETRKCKFTFAELEEIEQDFDKLTNWLAKIVERDFFPETRKAEAEAHLKRCDSGLRLFAERVFATEGAGPTKAGS